jgi:hypothetical protein
LRKNTKVLIPFYAKTKNCADLTIADLRKFGIEDILAKHPTCPTFFVYYCTQAGDILGKLMLTEKEMIFEPLNDKLKGFYNYMDGDFRNNTRMGFIVNFTDVVTLPEALVTRTRTSMMSSKSAKQTNENYYLRIDLCHTGNKYMCDDPEIVEKYESFFKNRLPIASFAIKINGKSLIGDKLLNEKKLERVNRLVSLIEEGWRTNVADSKSFTNVPCFDLHFHNICNIESKLEEEE